MQTYIHLNIGLTREAVAKAKLAGQLTIAEDKLKMLDDVVACKDSLLQECRGLRSVSIYMYISMYICTHMYIHTCICACACTRARARAHTHTHTHTDLAFSRHSTPWTTMCAHTRRCICHGKKTPASVCVSHARVTEKVTPATQSVSRACKHSTLHTHAHTCTHMHTHAHTCAHMRTHAHHRCRMPGRWPYTPICRLSS
jgi:hypothetical protein